MLRLPSSQAADQFGYRKLGFIWWIRVKAVRGCRLPYGANQQSHPGGENLGRLSPGLGRRSTTTFSGRRLELWKKARIQGSTPTAVQTNIHYPLDSELFEPLRRHRVARWLGRLREWEGIGFVDHTRRAKRDRNIRNRRGKKRADAYRDLIKVVQDGHYGEQALELPHSGAIQSGRGGVWPTIWSFAQSHRPQRRVLSGEAVAAQEKICSVFEEHTDILKKSPRETVFGHKVFLSTGLRRLIWIVWWNGESRPIATMSNPP